MNQPTNQVNHEVLKHLLYFSQNNENAKYEEFHEHWRNANQTVFLWFRKKKDWSKYMIVMIFDTVALK